MKGIDEYIACGINVAFGLGVGFSIFFFGCVGMEFLLYWRGDHWWNGWPGFLICTIGGAAVGFFSYIYRHHEFGEYPNSAWAGTSVLLDIRRVIIIAIAAATAIYLMWE